jgi:hypothetical protein
MNKREIKKCVLEIIDYLGSRNGFDNWWLQVEDNEESEITKKLEDIIERRLNQNKEDEDVSIRKIVRCEDPMVCLRGCSVHEQTCKHPIYENQN